MRAVATTPPSQPDAAYVHCWRIVSQVFKAAKAAGAAMVPGFEAHAGPSAHGALANTKVFETGSSCGLLAPAHMQMSSAHYASACAGMKLILPLILLANFY